MPGSPIHPPGGPQLTPGQGLDPNQPRIQAGPIVGVHSRSSDKSLLLFFGHEHYDEWEFRVEMLTGGLGRARFGGARVPASGMGMALTTPCLAPPTPNFPPPPHRPPPRSLPPPA